MFQNWLKHLPQLPEDFSEITTPSELAAWELNCFFPDRSYKLKKEPGFGDGFRITNNQIIGGETGLLYGVYSVLRHVQAGSRIPTESSPQYPLRMINSGTILMEALREDMQGKVCFLMKVFSHMIHRGFDIWDV